MGTYGRSSSLRTHFKSTFFLSRLTFKFLNRKIFLNCGPYQKQWNLSHANICLNGYMCDTSWCNRTLQGVRAHPPPRSFPSDAQLQALYRIVFPYNVFNCLSKYIARVEKKIYRWSAVFLSFSFVSSSSSFLFNSASLSPFACGGCSSPSRPVLSSSEYSCPSTSRESFSFNNNKPLDN